MLIRLFNLTLLIWILLILNSADGKGGRAGGFRSGSFRSPPKVNVKPNPVYRPPANPGYRSSFPSSRGGIRWSSFGAGMLAYGVMSNLASRNHYHSYNNYNRYGTGSGGSSGGGSTCINMEDFNGTVFGSFTCPMPGFDRSAKYCCGSKTDQTQYCCSFFDDDSRKVSTVVAIICIVGLVVCIAACAVRCAKKENGFRKYNDSNTFVQSPPNISNVNRNFGPRVGRPPTSQGPPGQYPRGPVPTQVPPGGQYGVRPAGPMQPPEGFPLLSQNSSANVNQQRPYPIHNTMPQPQYFNNKPNSQSSEAPPSYKDVINT